MTMEANKSLMERRCVIDTDAEYANFYRDENAAPYRYKQEKETMSMSAIFMNWVSVVVVHSQLIYYNKNLIKSV